ncbi:trk system potassium uptake protein TrkA [Fodinibius salinus]|uniref:Trk system potassium uptake protein TrkA n=1 Tax=Fodinibius salinus TaxID=860790 RepID=A0A5D3YJW9_9BACT|nr:TrkA family potassium uptake protein [Fodinibius salinus]TYP93740.1 trk system potassium uptake protein TrkA [Fodinibius salinus]
MYLIIVGAGSIGRRIVELATRDHHEVVVIEADKQTAREMAKEFECRVLHEKATEDDILKKAGIAEADALIATTNDDAVNLTSVLIGRQYGVPRLISSVSDPDHKELFRNLTVDAVADPNRLLGEYLYRNVGEPGLSNFIQLRGGAELGEIKLDKHSSLVGKTIMDALEAGLITNHDIVVAIYRKGELIIPRGDTQFEIGDTVTVLSKRGISNGIYRTLQRQ